jgi:hypothetical protein
MDPDPASRPRFFMTKVLNNLHFIELLMETAIYVLRGSPVNTRSLKGKASWKFDELA